MKKTPLATLAAALVVSIAVPAMAAPQGNGQRGGPRIERLMERFDANKDGAVLLDELTSQRNSMFETADTDKNGALSEQELAAFGDMRKAEREKARDQRRAERDGGQDGRNGKMGKHAGEREGKNRHAGKRDDNRHGENRRGGPRLERLDTDKNGEISAEEFAAMNSEMFERFDRNGDKKIDITDFYRNQANSADAKTDTPTNN